MIFGMSGCGCGGGGGGVDSGEVNRVRVLTLRRPHAPGGIATAWEIHHTHAVAISSMLISNNRSWQEVGDFSTRSVSKVWG